MDEIPENIWRVPAYLPYLQPDLTADAIGDAQASLGVTLPQTFTDLLRIQNGGYVRLKLPETPHSQFWGIGPYFPNLVGDHPWQNVEEFDEDEWFPEDLTLLVPFDGDGHWFLCLDYREAGADAEPGVAYVDIDSELDELIASSFGEFLTMLEEDFPGDTIGTISDHTLMEAIAALEDALGVKFEGPESFNHGYPQYRCRLGEGSPPEWVWINENEVLRGFVRPTDPRYAELSQLLPGTASQMPDHPTVRLILSCTDGAIKQVEAACAVASISTVSIATSVE